MIFFCFLELFVSISIMKLFPDTEEFILYFRHNKPMSKVHATIS